jgi:hypothetical protein
MLGYYVAGETGAVIGSLAGSGIADKYNKPYAGKTNINPHNLEYEEIPNSSRVGSSGTVIATASFGHCRYIPHLDGNVTGTNIS